MSCARVRRVLSDYHDCCAGERAARAVQRHLAECEGCAAEFAALRGTMDLLRIRKEERPPEAYWENFQSRLRCRLDERPSSAMGETWLRRFLAALGLSGGEAVFSPVGALALASLVLFGVHIIQEKRVAGPREGKGSSSGALAQESSRREAVEVAAATPRPLRPMTVVSPRGRGDIVLRGAGREGVDEFVLQPVSLGAGGFHGGRPHLYRW